LLSASASQEAGERLVFQIADHQTLHPPVRPELVSRPRLIERLNAGLHRKLTLISAPAGFGKATLLSEWVHHLETRFFPKNLVSGLSI